MRQRAAAAQTPPRSADSDHGQWMTPSRHRNSYQAVLEEPAQAQRSTSMMDAYANSSQTGVDSPPVENHPRRRRTSGQPTTNHANHRYQKEDRQQLQHSPQHYMAEYNKNFGAIENKVNDAPAPHSTGGMNYLHRAHSQTNLGYKSFASEVYYAQYTNHYDEHQSHSQLMSYADSSRPQNLRRNNSTGQTGRPRATTRNAHKASFQHFESTFHLDHNPTAAVHFRKSLHVPDNQYQEYIKGTGRVTTPILNPICCANICAGFSCVGFIFLVFIGILLDTQPLFIQGTLPSAIRENDSGKATTIYFVTAQRLPMASNAYQASYAYLATALACLFYLHFERLDSLVKARLKQDAADTSATSTLPTTVTDGEGGPMVAALDSAAYPQPNWNRFSIATLRLREWAGVALAKVWKGQARPKPRNKRNKASAKTV